MRIFSRAASSSSFLYTIDVAEQVHVLEGHHAVVVELVSKMWNLGIVEGRPAAYRTTGP